MEVIKITPRGYCHGVVGAIQLVRRVARDPNVPRPIYVLGQIVHNRHVVEEMEALGVITLDGEDRLSLLEKIDAGTVIFTAHGVSPAVKIRAREKGLYVVDATCPDVTRTHELIAELVSRGYEVIYIGKKGHPEPEGAVGVAPGHVHLVERAEDLEALSFAPGQKLAVTNQTTLSQWDTQALMEQVKARWPQTEIYNEICLATQQRQEAVARMAPEADLVIVVGDRRSNNSNRLVQVAQELAAREAHLVDSVEEIDPAWLKGKRKVAVTSGASTPTHITRAVIEFLEKYNVEVEER
ncbi:4-hydroxy-3-methylbut-2-enyl diphosphate reductase [Symbiobacterium thermophilum]|jgi:4-hydroxy-3-methylbut-2-enyl diphosphate reductase|uniref:4-hydroxy-3-methylbut-2-enyl diphosphate reductase n=2 Tax=Symbiobacterium thermophilum TaxID=2734 RepID=ISPH_SYMTH|nr:4-hydroxy-3-methylbut-2-enyl diphosphate reductase [Symbiobacterium thermophilum]Q67QZ8.1 RecName: Full=4-hydroxy-3-methylbut-2-enyl diphosphate reductase; Short=HMBPP reductase [Symbiobacterium thermophilum IAM 14863]MBY6275009.1 4-hydroxy-3-methylbut-2-enyl diphosphate reductase [Symbiobacterium thermophilum]BAD39895.1 1-hydroxy-2-methyl-2-(E)-butenyl 4-diphosphate reductase [Symbiobacterium thermophilum IAM 14863]